MREDISKSKTVKSTKVKELKSRLTTTPNMIALSLLQAKTLALTQSKHTYEQAERGPRLKLKHTSGSNFEFKSINE